MRKYIVCVLLALTAVLPTFAKKKNKNANTDPWELGPNEIILVGKVTVIPQYNREFFAKSRRLTQKEAEASDSYAAPVFNTSTATSLSWKKHFMCMVPETFNAVSKNGDYFCMKYHFSPNRHVELRYIAWYFFGKEKLNTALPIPINFDIPEGAKALYIGDFTYTVEGDFLEVTDLKTGDSLAQAQAALDASVNRHYDLQKADWQYNRQTQIVDYKHITGTPADSVVFYGGFCEKSSNGWTPRYTYIFSEVSPLHLYADQALTRTHFFVSSPVRPGSTYMLRQWIGYSGWTAAFTEADSLLTVQVPKEPGLYYFGAYEPYKSLTKDALTEEKRGYSAAQKREALEAALECYKGTVWEDCIRAELDKR